MRRIEHTILVNLSKLQITKYCAVYEIMHKNKYVRDETRQEKEKRRDDT